MKSIFIKVLFAALLSIETTASAAVLLETNFEDVQDWSTQRSWGSVLFPASWTLKSGGPTYAPPKKNNGDWLFPSMWVRTSGSAWAAPYQKQMAVIGAALGKDGSRGLEYNAEATGYATGGSPLSVYLGDGAGYHEVYVAFWAQYDPAWSWPETTPYYYQSFQKMFYLSRLNGNISDSQPMDLHLTLEDEVLYPSWYPHWVPHLDGDDYFRYQNRGISEDGTGAITYNDVNDLGSVHPEYYPNGTPIKWDDYKTGWHHYEFHAVLNSSPGVADGVQELWVDGVKRFSKTDRMFVAAGGSTSVGWNTVQISDNIWLKPEENATYYIHYDDFVISTTPIGASYVIGGPLGDTTPPISTQDKPAGRYLTKQAVSLSTEVGATTKYCLTPGCTPTATYSAPVTVLQNIAYQVLWYRSTDAANNVEAVKEAVFRKQKRR